MDRTSKGRGVWAVVGFAGAAALAAFGASSYPGCMVYNSSLIGSEMSDASAQDADFPACMPAEPPGRPPDDDGGGMDDGGMMELKPIVAAFQTIDIGVSGGPDAAAAIPRFGYDLDKTCTCPGPPSCLPRPGASKGENCDQPGGRDNTDITLFRALAGVATMGNIQVDQGLMAGQYGLLIRISNYNGSANDPDINVDFYVSNGLERDDAGAIPTPKFDGTDRWTIDPASLQNGNQPVYSGTSAYVRGGVFVASFGQIPIVFGDRSFLGGATMLLNDAVITGTLDVQMIASSNGGPPVLGLGITDGTIAGRWPTSQILATLATIPEEGGFLCGSDSTPFNVASYRVFRAVLCEAADIPSLQSQDNMAPLAPCDAVSVGMQFAAVPAVLGDPLMVPPAPAGCVDAGPDGSLVLWSDQCP